ncbi:hypothetical protein MNBD_ALPHA09-1201 [hydrothermal vent metagenome]|uniref:Uncharacterized protein n=1 Tax=hydrothermal vent metagenome TaxID=652676 RepID=A0A3B0TX58_9ZZZZ
MTSAKTPNGPVTPAPTNLTPVVSVGQARRGRTGGGGLWRPAAPFIAQMIGERAEGNKLSRARRNVPSILSAYGDAALLAPRAPQTLDCLA